MPGDTVRPSQQNNDLSEIPADAQSIPLPLRPPRLTLWDSDCCEIDGVPADDTQGEVALASAGADRPVGVNHGADALSGDHL